MKIEPRCVVLLSLALRFVWAQAPDVILLHGKIFTSNAGQLWVEALAIRGERISTVGSNDTIRQLADDRTLQIDLEGRTVVPGFNDAHWHQLVRTPVTSFSVPASPGPVADPPFANVLTALASAVGSVPKDQVLQTTVGPLVFDDPAATRFELDRIAPDHRVWIGTLGHGRLLNTAALRAIGIGEEEPDPVGGWYERVEGSRTITGKLFGYADLNSFRCQHYDVIESVAVGRIQTTVRNALQFGVTSIQDMPSLPPKQMVKLLAAADVPIRWRLIRNLPSQPLTCPGVEDWSDPVGPLHPMVTLSGYKWFVDGTPAERLAATWDPYDDRPDWFGHFYLPFPELGTLIAQSAGTGEQLLFHVSGDRTADNLFLGLTNLGNIHKLTQQRLRLEHGDVLSPYQFERLRDLGMIVVHNPLHSGPVAQLRLGSQSYKLQPIKSLLRAGIPIAFGSDGTGPAMLNPFANLRAAITHPANPQEALTTEDAVIAYTAGSAYAELAEKQKGTLAPGMFADLAVLSQDIFTISLDQFSDVHSVLTMVGGKIVYASPPYGSAGQ